MNDLLTNEFKKNVYLKPDAYLNGWAKKCGWKATLVYDSLWRHADKNGISFPSIELMAEEHGVSRKTIIRGLKTLIEYNLVNKESTRDKKGKFLHNTYILTDKSKWKDISISLLTKRVSKSPQGTRVSKSPAVPIQVPSGDYKGTHNKGTHITLSISPPVIEGNGKTRYNTLASLTPQVLLEIALQYHVPPAFVRLQFEKMKNWLEAKGKTYKNYNAGLRGFVLRDMQKSVERKSNDKYRAVDARGIK